MLVKVLGAIDLAGALAFLMLIFGLTVPLQFALFCAGLLLLKGLFIFLGDSLSLIDIFSASTLLLSIFILPPSIILWMPAFLLLAKGFASFF